MLTAEELADDVLGNISNEFGEEVVLRRGTTSRNVRGIFKKVAFVDETGSVVVNKSVPCIFLKIEDYKFLLSVDKKEDDDSKVAVGSKTYIVDRSFGGEAKNYFLSGKLYRVFLKEDTSVFA